MFHSPRSLLRPAAVLLSALALLSGCLHYDERGTIATDGSGEVRVVYSMGPGGEIDKDKQAEVRAEVAATQGVEILGDIDSTDGDTTWVGMRLRFASLQALGAVDTILPLKGMFQALALRQENGVWIFSRTVRLLPAPTEGMDMPRFRQVLTWTVPGTVVDADTLARWSSGDRVVTWNLPNDGHLGTSADLEVRWTDADTVRLALPWMWIGLGAGALLLLVVALPLLRRRKAAAPVAPAPSATPESVSTLSAGTAPSGAVPGAEAPALDDAAAPPAEASPEPSPAPVAPAVPAAKPRRFRPSYFLSPSLLLAAFGLFALAPVVNVSCAGRAQQMTGWQLAHQSPDFRSQLSEMQDMAETIGSGEDLHDKSLDEAASGTAPSQKSNDVTLFLWSILAVAGLCVVVPWERAQGLAALLFGGGLVAFQHKLGEGMANPIPELAKFLKIERLASWHVVQAILVLAALSGLWSIVSSLRGGKARKGWIPSVLVALLAGAVAFVVIQGAKGAFSGSPSGPGIDTTSSFEMPADTAMSGDEEVDTASDGGAEALEPFHDDRDDRTYPVVQGPSGPWMGRNLAFVADSSWCFPAPGVDCEREGRLYDWEAAEQACPAGWHLPTLDEAEGLVGSVGEDAVSLLRAGPEGSDEPETGVALVATGWGGPDGGWNDHGRTISLWVTQPGRAGGPFVWQINAGDQVSTGPASPHSRHGVRCVSDGE